MAYIIEFAESVKEHMRYLSAFERALMLDSVDEQLTYEPLVETRNRKQLRPNPLAPWELRVDDLRAYYDVTSDAPGVVQVLAVGRKIGNRVMIAGREVRL